MARKIDKVKITKKGRDFGKSFQIKEMPINRADKWANTALLAMMRGGIDVGGVDFGLIANTLINDGKPKIDPVGGMLELARISIAGLGNVTTTIGQDLLDQLIRDCVKIIPDGGTPRSLLMPNIDDPDDDTEGDIEDLSTLWELRKAAFVLHVGFLAEGSSQT